MHLPKRRKYNDKDQRWYCASPDDEAEDGERKRRTRCNSSCSNPPVQEKQERDEHAPLDHAFKMDEIVSNISSFCDFETNATALRCVTKKVNEIVDHDLHQMSKSLLPFECTDSELFISNEGLSVEVSAKVYLQRNISAEFRCRESFFQNVKDSIYDELVEISECDVEDQDLFKRAFDELLKTNGTIKLSDFNLQGQEGRNDIVVLRPQDDSYFQQEELQRLEDAPTLHIIEDEKAEPGNNRTTNDEDSEIKYHHKQAIDQQKDWKLTFVQKHISLQESFKQLETNLNKNNDNDHRHTMKSKPESLDAVNTLPLLSIFHDLPLPVKQIDLAEFRKCLFGLLIKANPSSINYYRLSMNDRHIEGCAEMGLKGALTFITEDNDEIEFGVEVWLQFDSPP